MLYGGAAPAYRVLHKIRIAHRPLKRLLRPHGKTEHGNNGGYAELFRQQSIARFDIVPDRDSREIWPIERGRRIAWRT